MIWSVYLRTCLHLQLQQALGDAADCVLGSCILAAFALICSGKRNLATIASGAIVSDHRRYLTNGSVDTSNTSSLSCVAERALPCSVQPRHNFWCGEACQYPCSPHRFVFLEISNTSRHHQAGSALADHCAEPCGFRKHLNIAICKSSSCFASAASALLDTFFHCAAILVSSKAMCVFVCVVVSSHH
jgi:hypothetical protein